MLELDVITLNEHDADFHSVIFFIYSLFFAGGERGVCVATKWDFLGRGHVWATLRVRLRLGIVSGVWFSQI